MSAENLEPELNRLEAIGRSDGESDAELWGEVPQDQRLEWLRVASRNWPYFPGATVGGLTARALSQGHLVHSESLIRVARNAFEAGFTPDEYATLRRLIRGRVPAHVVIARDRDPERADKFLEIDAHRCRGWLDLVRSGRSTEAATESFLAAETAGPAASKGSTDYGVSDPTSDGLAPSVQFGSGESLAHGWDIPLGHGHGRHGWWRVFEVFPPRRGVGRTGTGKYASAADGAEWEAELISIADGLASVGFAPQDLYVLSLTLERLTDDQWARVDKRLFTGAGLHAREGWMLSPLADKWTDWPRLVHVQGLLPHEATEVVLGGIWHPKPWR